MLLYWKYFSVHLVLPQGLLLGVIKPIKSLPKMTPLLEEKGPCYDINNVQLELFLGRVSCSRPAFGNKQLLLLGEGWQAL